MDCPKCKSIPNVLKSLDIEDAVVTIDSIGTQTKIAELIRDKKGHYPVRRRLQANIYQRPRSGTRFDASP